MKKLSGKLLLLFFALGVLNASAQPNASTMQFSSSVWDFGTIKELDGPVEHTFEFTNTGKNAFVIENVIVSCGCTTPEYTKAPVMPGKKGTVKIIFDPAGRPGVFSKDITVVSNGRRNRNTITVKGEVSPRPRTVEDDYPIPVGGGLRVDMTATGMGYIPRGATKSIVINYYNSSNAPITLAAVEHDKAPYFKLDFSNTTLEPKGRGVLTITYDLRNADVWGRVENEFDITVNGRRCDMKFSSTGIAADDFSAISPEQSVMSPKAVFVNQYHNFGNVKAGSANRRSFTFVNDGGSPLVVRYVKCGDGVTTTLRAGTTVPAGGELNFDTTLTIGNDAKGKVNGDITIIFNDPDRPLREIRLAATIM